MGRNLRTHNSKNFMQREKREKCEVKVIIIEWIWFSYNVCLYRR